MKLKYERLMHIEQVLSKLERCVPMGLRKEVEISQALHNVGQLIEVREASISVACLLDEGVSDSLRKDIEHIQDQITIIENFLEPFTVAELEEMSDG